MVTWQTGEGYRFLQTMPAGIKQKTSVLTKGSVVFSWYTVNWEEAVALQIQQQLISSRHSSSTHPLSDHNGLGKHGRLHKHLTPEEVNGRKSSTSYQGSTIETVGTHYLDQCSSSSLCPGIAAGSGGTLASDSTTFMGRQALTLGHYPSFDRLYLYQLIWVNILTQYKTAVLPVNFKMV